MSTRAVKQKLNELLTASENGNVAVIDKVSKLKLKRKALKEKKKAAKAAKATPSTKATDNLQRNLQYLERTNTPSIEQQELLQKRERRDMATGQLRGQQPATAVTARPSSWRGISNMARGTSRSRVPKLQHHVRSRHSSAAAPSAAAASGRAGGGSGDDGLLAAAGILALLAQQQQSSQQTPPPTGAHLVLADVGFHPAGCEKPLLDGVSMHLPANKLGLLVGRSGSGKTTLLQVLAGLTEQTSGQIYMSRQPLPRGVIDAATRGSGSGSGGAEAPAPSLPPGGTSLSQRMSDVGLVFQFPERHFLGDNIVNELTFTWPRTMEAWPLVQQLSTRMTQVVTAVGLQDIPLYVPPTALSGGQQRRLALALQLIRQPSLLLLDEPLAGLDWRAKAEVVALLAKLKKQCTVLVVSHDLREIAPLVDMAWRMQPGGRLAPQPLTAGATGRDLVGGD